jgi:magnesium chelatase subunit D
VAGIRAVVVDCESGRMRIGLAGQLAAAMGAQHLPLEDVAADALTATVRSVAGSAHRASRAA